MFFTFAVLSISSLSGEKLKTHLPCSPSLTSVYVILSIHTIAATHRLFQANASSVERLRIDIN
jgi:hypothetical protein